MCLNICLSVSVEKNSKLIVQIMDGSDSYAFWELSHGHFDGLLWIVGSCVCVEPPPRVYYMVQICFWSGMEMMAQPCIALEMRKLWV